MVILGVIKGKYSGKVGKLSEKVGKFSKSVREFDSFIKMQLLVEFVVGLGWALILPVVAKLQGLLWAVSVIAFYNIVKYLSNFLLPLLDNIKIKDAYRYIIIMDVLYLVCIPLYFVDEELFLIAEATVIVVYTVIMNKFKMIYDRFLAIKYKKKDEYEHIKNADKMIESLAYVVGYTIVIIVGRISSDMKVILGTFMVLLSVIIAFEIYNYRTYWTEENLKVLEEDS